MNLFEQLISYSKEDMCPMHMPGHKRNPIFTMPDPYRIDLTEIDGFDDLYEADGILLELMNRASSVYHTQKTFLSVNGSTLGILAGISACTKRGDTILIARNSHRSVYHAAFLRGLHTEYILPEITDFQICAGITAADVAVALCLHPDTKLVVLTSPTYEGMLSELDKISTLLHRLGILLLVDEAHGAHLGFHPSFYGSAISAGADIVIHSLHKTLPALTQTALLHICSDAVDLDAVKDYIRIYQTSSPSYVLMSSIDQCITLLEQDAQSLFEPFSSMLSDFYSAALQWKHIKLLPYTPYTREPSKLVISAADSGFSGLELYHLLLDEYQIQPEMCTPAYIICMTTIADTSSTLTRLFHALSEIDHDIGLNQKNGKTIEHPHKFVAPLQVYHMRLPERYLFHFEAEGLQLESIPLDECNGRISAEYIYLYPPGIPFIIPGEVIDASLLTNLEYLTLSGFELKGMHDPTRTCLRVLCLKGEK